MSEQVGSTGTSAAGTTVQSASGLPHLMFFQPRLPGNTGSTIRLAAVTGARLHLIEPLGFDLDEPKLRRAGLDYHDMATVEVHPDLDAALDALPDARVFAFVTRATTLYTDVIYRPDDVLLFGPETSGLSDDLLAHPRISGRVAIPMLAQRRSLNLANAASIVIYEAWRQLGFVHGR
ncbi:MAG: tRNA (cytidine(34)-2'-O)-methyltransferase [Nitriliruptoraceae bacterium]